VGVEIERNEEILPELPLEAGVELHALTAGIAQARVVLQADVEVRFEGRS
jgi:hypothetical protein